METFANIITNLGFPIGVSIYLLVRFEKKIDKLENAISGKDGLIVAVDKNTEVTKKCAKALEEK